MLKISNIYYVYFSKNYVIEYYYLTSMTQIYTKLNHFITFRCGKTQY